MGTTKITQEELDGQVEDFVRTVNQGITDGEHGGQLAFDWQLPDGRWLTITRRPARGQIDRSRVRVVTADEMARILEK